MSGLVGRADLLRALLADDAVGGGGRGDGDRRRVEAVARAGSFRRRASLDASMAFDDGLDLGRGDATTDGPDPHRSSARDDEATSASDAEPEPPPGPPPVAFWRPVDFERFEDPPPTTGSAATAEDEQLTPADVAPSVIPEPDDLLPWRDLRRRFDAFLSRHAGRREVDVPRAVNRLARGFPVERLHLRHRPATPGVWLIVDRSNRLVPIWTDQLRLARRLRRLLGPLGVVTWSFYDGPGPNALILERVRRVPARRPGDRETFVVDRDPPRVPADAIAVALTDLGVYGTEADRRRWRTFGRDVRRGGHVAHALVPAPRARLSPWMETEWGVTSWNDHPESEALESRESSVSLDASDSSSSARSSFSPSVTDVTDVAAVDPEDDSASTDPKPPAARRVLRLLAPAIRVEPALLRAVRRALPELGGVDVEFDTWLAEPPERRHVAGLDVQSDDDGERLDELRRALETDAELRHDFRRVLDVLRRTRRSAGRLVRFEELLGIDALAKQLGEDDVLTADERIFLQGLAQRIEATVMAHPTADPQAFPGLAAWVVGCRERLPIGGDRTVERAMERAAAAIDRGETALHGTPWRWAVVQRGAKLVVVADEESESVRGGVVLERFEGTPGTVRLEGDDGFRRVGSFRSDDRRFDSIDTASTADEPLRSEPFAVDQSRARRIVVTSDVERLTLEKWMPSDSILEVIRDDAGLRCEVPDNEVSFVFRWRLDRDEASKSRGARGRWLVESRPSWASDAGIDQYGIHATVTVDDDVSFRMRWIPPGRFFMGASAAEKEFEDEIREHYERNDLTKYYRSPFPRHEVEFREGTWVAETPCTQAVWETVTDENPSRFRTPNRPVEKVSFEDVAKFIDRLNRWVPSLEVRLPSEAEWEYACRAGTTMSTYAGEFVRRGMNDAPVLEDIAWYGGNSGVDFELDEYDDSSSWSEKSHSHERAGSHPVGGKRANPWGLYDMLGNVLEWCADGAREYVESDDAVVGPIGEVDEDEGLRVFRGGSWFFDARNVRAAFRSLVLPSSRRDVLGFRLARGQGAQGGARENAERSVEDAGEARPEAGRGTRPDRGKRSRS